jgi:hypothetical protein
MYVVRVELAQQIHRQHCRLALSIVGCFAFGVDLPTTFHKIDPVDNHGHDVHAHL